MPNLSNAMTDPAEPAAVWTRCAACGVWAAFAPEADLCRACTPVDGAGLSRAQADGLACVVCGDERAPMVPVGYLPGWGQVFACDWHDDVSGGAV